MLKVLVTGIGGGGVGEQIIKALRLSKITLEIIGTDITKLSKGINDVDRFFLLPRASCPNYLQELIRVCTDEQVKVLFPGSEQELMLISNNKETFHDLGIYVPINPKSLIEICLDKTKTIEFLNFFNFKAPQSKTILNEVDLESIDFFPVVLKPSIGGGGSANIMVAQSKEELLLFGKYLLNIYSEFIVQEYIGNPFSEYTVGVLFNHKGELINSIAIKRIIHFGLGSKINIKNRTSKLELGENLVISSGISQGEVMPRFELNEICEDIATKLGATSTLNIQCRYVNGEAFVFEINPRFSGTTSLRAIAGYNEPEILINSYLFSKEVPRNFGYKTGYILRGLNENFISNT